ncbi:ABC transporter permease [Azospirillum sp. B506]|uniref:ABC transporter permease n=1 Tax=Azospirillum sp. B506 TaxID=137721 RepID=UPI00131EF6BE|nr:ABC transporter permease [Azospirillum sp. B506]
MLARQVWPLLGCALLVVLWALAARGAPTLLPPPGDVALALVDLAQQGRLAADAWASVSRVLMGLAVAVAATLVLAVPAAVWPAFGAVASGPIELVRPVPPIAWVPLAIMAFGVGTGAAVAIVALGAFLPLWLATAKGLRLVRRSHLLAARSLGAGWRLLLTDVAVPSVLPHFLHGLRLGVGLGWFSVVAAEMMGVPSGLGQGVQRFSLNLEMARLYAYIVAVGAIGFAWNALLLPLEGRACHWLTDGGPGRG